MATTTSNASNNPNGKTKSQTSGKDTSRFQALMKLVTDIIAQDFTVLQKMHCENIIASVAMQESSFNPHSKGKKRVGDNNDVIRNFYTTQQYKNWFNQGGASANGLEDVHWAWGLMGVMGWQHYDWSFGGWKPDIVRHPAAKKYGLICDPVKNPVHTMYANDNDGTKGLVAGLIVFEANFTKARQRLKAKMLIDDTMALKMAVAAHIGSGYDPLSKKTSDVYMAEVVNRAARWQNGEAPVVASTNTNYAAQTNSADVAIPLKGC